MHSKLQQKPALLSGEHNEPTKTSLSLEQSKRSFPLYIPLTGAFKIAAKTSTLRSFPDYIPLTGALKIAAKTSTFKKFPSLHTFYWCFQHSSKNQHFWDVSLSTYPLRRASERGLTNGPGHSSINCIQQSIWNITVTDVYSHNFFKCHIVSWFTVGCGVASVQG